MPVGNNVRFVYGSITDDAVRFARRSGLCPILLVITEINPLLQTHLPIREHTYFTQAV